MEYSSLLLDWINLSPKYILMRVARIRIHSKNLIGYSNIPNKFSFISLIQTEIGLKFLMSYIIQQYLCECTTQKIHIKYFIGMCKSR